MKKKRKRLELISPEDAWGPVLDTWIHECSRLRAELAQAEARLKELTLDPKDMVCSRCGKPTEHYFGLRSANHFKMSGWKCGDCLVDTWEAHQWPHCSVELELAGNQAEVAALLQQLAAVSEARAKSVRAFDEEFARQVDNNLCGGPACINPHCYCDEE